MKEKVLTILPIKTNSRRVPEKNIKCLGNKIMFLYSLEQTLIMNIRNNYYLLSVYGKQALRLCLQYVDSLYKSVSYPPPRIDISDRPKYLAEDPYQIVDVCLYEVKRFEKKNRYNISTIIIIQADNPFILAEDIEGCYKKFIDNDRCAVTTVVKEVPSESSFFGMTKSGDVLRPICGSSIQKLIKSNFPDSYKITGGITIIDRNELFEKELQYVDKMIGYEIPMERAINIDTPYDFEIAEYFMKKRKIRKDEKRNK